MVWDARQWWYVMVLSFAESGHFFWWKTFSGRVPSVGRPKTPRRPRVIAEQAHRAASMLAEGTSLPENVARWQQDTEGADLSKFIRRGNKVCSSFLLEVSLLLLLTLALLLEVFFGRRPPRLDARRAAPDLTPHQTKHLTNTSSTLPISPFLS